MSIENMSFIFTEVSIVFQYKKDLLKIINTLNVFVTIYMLPFHNLKNMLSKG
jgi:hypothetical protein